MLLACVEPGGGMSSSPTNACAGAKPTGSPLLIFSGWYNEAGKSLFPRPFKEQAQEKGRNLSAKDKVNWTGPFKCACFDAFLADSYGTEVWVRVRIAIVRSKACATQCMPSTGQNHVYVNHFDE